MILFSSCSGGYLACRTPGNIFVTPRVALKLALPEFYLSIRRRCSIKTNHLVRRPGRPVIEGIYLLNEHPGGSGRVGYE